MYRRGILRVVIATGTLSIGINAPAKTCIFGGDSIFLTALNFRQCSGRAGRRGFDTLGNVLFVGVSLHRIERLLVSRLPKLGGSFPLTTTLVLRMHNLLYNSDEAVGPSSYYTNNSLTNIDSLSPSQRFRSFSLFLNFPSEVPPVNLKSFTSCDSPSSTVDELVYLTLLDGQSLPLPLRFRFADL